LPSIIRDIRLHLPHGPRRRCRRRLSPRTRFIQGLPLSGSLEDRPRRPSLGLFESTHRVVNLRDCAAAHRPAPAWTGESLWGQRPRPSTWPWRLRLSGPLARALARIPRAQRAALLLAEVGDLTGLELPRPWAYQPRGARALLTRAREKPPPGPRPTSVARRKTTKRPSTATYAEQSHAADTRRRPDDTPGAGR